MLRKSKKDDLGLLFVVWVGNERKGEGLFVGKQEIPLLLCYSTPTSLPSASCQTNALEITDWYSDTCQGFFNKFTSFATTKKSII